MLKFWVTVLFSFSVCAQEDLSVLASLTSSADHQVIKRPAYELSYNDHHEVANYVAYYLDHSRIKSCVNRADNFRPDPEVIHGSASLADYSGSGYDRGHLLPAGDMKFSAEAMSNTFYMSNMTPQPARFNRGRWGTLENVVRTWALKYKKIWIVTGPILKDDLPFIGKDNKVSVPRDYYKVIMRFEDGKWKGIGFLMSTDVPFERLQEYVVSIDTIEDLSGIDFFPTLSDPDQNEAESTANESDWDFAARFNYLPCSP